MSVNFSQCKIYKISCKDESITDCYVGSTTNLDRRRWEHSNYTNNYSRPEHKFPVYKFIREHGNWDNWEVIILEEFKNCKSSIEKRQRERFWIEKLKSKLNVRIPSRTRKEWKRDNHERCLEYGRKHREKKRKEKLKKEEIKNLFGNNFIEIN